MPDLTVDVFQRLLAPKAFQIFQEREQRAELKDAAAQELGLGGGVAQEAGPGGAGGRGPSTAWPKQPSGEGEGEGEGALPVVTTTG